MIILLQLAIGLIVSAGIGIAAYKRGALSKSGVAGAILTGTASFGFGGWVWGMLLITFFVLSSLLSKYKESVKASLAEKFAKGSQRDVWQALANAGVGALIALAYPFFHHPTLFFAFIGAMATVNADTWATELGVLSQRPPRLITTGARVEPGTSGGISPRGTLATLAGGFVIGLTATALMFIDEFLGGLGVSPTGGDSYALALILPFVAAFSGLTGSLCDSLLGATVQAIYYSTAREKETERPIDHDGTPNRLLRGWRWLNNDWVNFISSAVGAIMCAIIWVLIAGG